MFPFTLLFQFHLSLSGDFFLNSANKISVNTQPQNQVHFIHYKEEHTVLKSSFFTLCAMIKLHTSMFSILLISFAWAFVVKTWCVTKFKKAVKYINTILWVHSFMSDYVLNFMVPLVCAACVQRFYFRALQVISRQNHPQAIHTLLSILTCTHSPTQSFCLSDV